MPRMAGVPAFSEGKPIRLTSLETGVRQLGKAKLPTVAIADPASRQRLDELIDRAHEGRCKVALALETVVSMRCDFTSEMTQMDDASATHFRVGAAGDVEIVDPWSLFHPGLTGQQWVQLLLHDPTVDDRFFPLLTRTGLDLVSVREGEEEVVRLPWRSLAPYVVADGPLGAVLAAEGLELAAVGTTLPGLPAPSPAIWGELDEMPIVWMRMPTALRARARLIMPGARDPAALVFAPDVQANEIQHYAVGIGEAYFVEPATKLGLARATAPIVVREKPGTKTEIAVRLPTGTLLPAAIGMIDRTQSGLDPRHWAFVGGLPYGSWVAGRSLEAADRCAHVEPGSSGGSLALHGIADFVRAGETQRVLWLAYALAEPGYMQIHVHPLDGCAVGKRSRALVFESQLTTIGFTPATAGGDTLIIAVTSETPWSARVVQVFGPSSDEPVFRRQLVDDAVEIGATRGPDGAPQVVPLVLGSGKARVWLTWDGTTLVERSSP